MVRTAAGREANRHGPAVSSPLPFFFISATAAPSSSSRILHFLAHSALRFRAFRRSPSAVARLSPVARRTHAVLPPDFAARRSSAATSPHPPHLRFFASFSASPSTVLAGDRRSAPPPANTSLSDCAAQGWYQFRFARHLLAFQILGLRCSYFFFFFGFLLTRRSSRGGQVWDFCFSAYPSNV
jgi:hypothetical protein